MTLFRVPIRRILGCIIVLGLWIGPQYIPGPTSPDIPMVVDPFGGVDPMVDFLIPANGAYIAGIKAGDRVQLLNNTFEQRLSMAFPKPGDKFIIRVHRDNHSFNTTVLIRDVDATNFSRQDLIQATKHPELYGKGPTTTIISSDSFLELFGDISNLLFVFLACVLLLFGQNSKSANYLAAFCAANVVEFPNISSTPLTAATLFIIDLLIPCLAGYFLVAAVVNYPFSAVPSPIRLFKKYGIILTLVFLAVFAGSIAWGLSAAWIQPELLGFVSAVIQVLYFIVAATLISWTMVVSRGDTRNEAKNLFLSTIGAALISWVLFTSYVFLFVFGPIIKTLPRHHEYGFDLTDSTGAATLGTAIALTFSVLTRRILSIRVVLQRTAVTGTVTVLLYVIYSIASYLATQAEAMNQSTRPFVAIVAIFIVVWLFPRIQSTIPNIVNKIFYKRLQRSEARVKAAIAVAPLLGSVDAAAKEIFDSVSVIYPTSDSEVFLVVASGNYKKYLDDIDVKSSIILGDSAIAAELLASRGDVSSRTAPENNHEKHYPIFSGASLTGIVRSSTLEIRDDESEYLISELLKPFGLCIDAIRARAVRCQLESASPSAEQIAAAYWSQ